MRIWKAIQAITLCLLCVTAATFVLVSRATEPASGSEKRDSAFIAEELRRCPYWVDVPPEDTGRRQAITHIYLKLSRYRTDVIREGVRLYLGSSISDRRPEELDEAIKAGDTVFAFERVVFNVPARVRVGERIPFAFRGNPSISKDMTTYIDFLWPYSMGSDGRLVLSGVMGAYSGVVLDQMADFDEMAARLPRRPVTQP
jgi:hypothetical protein